MRGSRVGPLGLARIVGLSTLTVLLAACGKSHGGGPTTPSNSPVIADLGVTTLAQGCTVQGFSGKVRTVSLGFTDPDGNESGGHVDLSLTAAGTVLSSLTVPVPSSGVILKGTTSGTITISPLCIAIVGGPSAALNATLTDAAGNPSNGLSTTVAALQRASGSSGSAEGRRLGAIDGLVAR